MGEIERGRGVALWSQISAILADDILKGVLRQGEQLPSAQELAARFNVNRHTVRRAMAALEQRDLVRTEQGRGTFVQEHALDYPISRRTRFTQNMRNLNVEADIEVLEDAREIPPPQVAQALGMDRHAHAYRIETISCADGTSWITAPLIFRLRVLPACLRYTVACARSPGRWKNSASPITSASTLASPLACPMRTRHA